MILFIKVTQEQLKKKCTNKDSDPLIVDRKTGRCTNIFNAIHISPTNIAYACCGLTVQYIPFLRLGSLQKHSLKFLYEYQFQDFIKIWLFTEGPQGILDFCMRKRNLQTIDTKGWHICQVCIEIFKDEENVFTLQKNYQEVFSNIIFKYSIMKKKYLQSLKNKKL